MERRARAIADGRAGELVWLLEHPPLYTAGTSARGEDLLETDRFPVHNVGRGGQYTYHGPGQRIAYVMLDLKARGGDVRAFVARLETWLIETIATFEIAGVVRPGRVGVWVVRDDPAGGPPCEDKIAALGIRVSRGVTTHGFALNVSPDLSHFSGIVPCGIAGHGVTSLAALGKTVAMPAVDAALRAHFEARFEAVTVPVASMGTADT
jgi:lipoyl(octanoyl) transferase